MSNGLGGGSMARRPPGFFLTFEGIDRSGKSTQIAFTHGFLTRLGFEVVVTREPGGTPLGQKLRRLLLDMDESDGMAPETELLLLAADRSEHVAKCIRPALAEGKIVVSDRYVHSSLAYQGYGLGIDLSVVRRVNEIATGGLLPDLTIVLDLPARMRQQRTVGGSLDRIEARDEAFHERVRKGFLELAQQEPGRIVVIDASAPQQQVQQALQAVLQQRVVNELRRESVAKGAGEVPS